MIEYDSHLWFDHFFDIKGSMLREITGRVLACVVWSAAVVAFDLYVYPVTMSSGVHGLVGFAIGLLLVFRTNASYDRFWEGRRMWGAIVNETRNLGRNAVVHLKTDRALLGELIRWTVAFAYATMHGLRREVGLGPVADRLPPAQARAATAADHVPLAISARLSALLVEARDRGLISDYVLAMLDQNVQLLIDYMGACERIQKTPLPFAYVVHLRRAVILYCFTLPFTLIEDFGWWAIALTFLLTYLFFGIEEIGVEIENPFGYDDNDLPLEAICATIERNLLNLIDEAGPSAALLDVGEPVAPVAGL